MTPNPAEQAVLVLVQGSRAKGDSYALIADSLNADRIPTKYGGRWFPAMVRSVLRNASRWAGAAETAGPANGGVVFASYTEERPYTRRANRG